MSFWPYLEHVGNAFFGKSVLKNSHKHMLFLCLILAKACRSRGLFGLGKGLKHPPLWVFHGRASSLLKQWPASFLAGTLSSS